MGARHSGREAALQMLFQMEASGGDAEEVVRGVGAEVRHLDELIAGASAHWRVERMARVDRNVLRLGAWELAHRENVPRAVVLDEAVELAKSYGSDESSAFVNGVLNRIAETLGRRDPVRDGEAG